jgi:hypothetical protein
MALLVYIDDILIPDEDIIQYPSMDESLSFEGLFSISDETTLKLDNIDQSLYDPRYSGSLFEAYVHIGDRLYVYNNIKGINIIDGILDNIKPNDKEIELTVLSLLASVIDKTCQFSSTSNKTPAQLIYEILTDPDNGNIDASFFDYSGFQDAINIQDANSLYCNIILIDDSDDTSNSKTIGTAINELSRICSGNVYTREGKICFYQYQDYSGKPGFRITADDVIAGSYTEYLNRGTDFPVYESYSIAYDSSGTIKYKKSSNVTDNRFLVPDEDPSSDSTSDITIICKNSTGAEWSGELAVSRFEKLLLICEFKLFGDFDFLHVGDQVDLCFDGYSGEPVLIYERESDVDADIISFKCFFLNYPVEKYSRDKTPPDQIDLLEVSGIDGTLQVQFTQSGAADLLGYKLYFTTNPGSWKQDVCNYGQSPIDIKNPTPEDDGTIIKSISQLSPGAKYYVKVTAYDAVLNESEDSPIKTNIE